MTAGDQPPVVTEDLGSMMCEYYREIGIFAHEEPVRDVVDRIEALDPDCIHLPGIFVHRIIQGQHEKRIEQRTTRKRETA